MYPRHAPADGGACTWARWPGHAAVARPPCSTASCRRPSMAWRRCARCRAPIARCNACPSLDQAVTAHAARCAA